MEDLKHLWPLLVLLAALVLVVPFGLALTAAVDRIFQKFPIRHRK